MLKYEKYGTLFTYFPYLFSNKTVLVFTNGKTVKCYWGKGQGGYGGCVLNGDSMLGVNLRRCLKKQEEPCGAMRDQFDVYFPVCLNVYDLNNSALKTARGNYEI